MGHGEPDNEPLDGGHDDVHPLRGAPPDPLDRVWVHPTELAFRGPDASGRASRSWLVPAVAGAAGALVTVAVLAAAGVLDREAATVGPATTAAAREPDGAPLAEAKRASRSVVAVSARDARGVRRGSGVCVRHGSEILTSARLVGDATTVEVITGDGKPHTARVVGRDRTTDLVLLEIDGAVDLPAAELGNGAPPTGSPVWIVAAAPAGTKSIWMSGGVLSSNDAIVSIAGGPTTSGVLETDAEAGATAAGAALVDDRGTVVGIVIGRLGRNQTTYAIPIRDAVAVADQLHDDGVAQHGSAGFEGVDTGTGPTVTAVSQGGPAARAGMHVGDVVVAVDGRGVSAMSEVVAIVRAHAPGHTVELEIRRDRGAYKLRVVLDGMGR